MYGIVAASTLVIFVLSFVLTLILSRSYSRARSSSLLFWSAGMWVFSVSVLIEAIFSFGFYSQGLIKLYLVLVAAVVELLAMGSVALLSRRNYLYAYCAYSVMVTAFLVYEISTVGSIGDLLLNGVVYGVLPMVVTVGSVLITVPAAVLLVVISLVSYRKSKNPKLLSIILGVIVVSIAGTLYIAAFPAFLYYSEFIGILLLWIGFVDFRSIRMKWNKV